MRLKLDKVNVTYHGRSESVEALRGASLSVDDGEFVAIVGPSGSGKSTLLLTAGTLLRPASGQVLIEDNDVYALPLSGRDRLRHNTIGFVFQQFHLVPYLTVLENIQSPALAGPVPELAHQTKRLIDQFGLPHRADHLPHELSTGEKQRVAMARAMLNKPTLILADEPTGNLDEDNGRIVIAHLADAARGGCAVLMVTHDPRAADYATRTLKLKEGRLEG